MILPFNADRLLTRVATAGSHHGEGRPLPGVALGSLVEAATAMGAVGPLPPVASGRGGTASLLPANRFERLIATGVAGEPEQLHHSLTADAHGWSPAFWYSSRTEAVTQLRDHTSPLLVVDFAVDRLWWSAPWLCSEWSLVALHADPFLVADDVLIDVCDAPVHLAGASVIELRDDRMATVHTYYDEGALVEQVILGEHVAAGKEREFPSPP